jgi:hypothetical protein
MLLRFLLCNENKLKCLTFVYYIRLNSKMVYLNIVWRAFFSGILFFALAFIVSIQSSAQNDTIVPIDKDPEEILRDLDLREYSYQGFNLWEESFSGHWAGFDFGFNMFVNQDYTGYEFEFMDNDLLRSNSAYINIIQKNFGLQRNRNTIGLLSGIGLHLQSYRLENNTTLRRLEDGQIQPQVLYFDHNQKSKFAIFSLMAPLLCEFQFPLNHYRNRIYISGGVYGAVRLGSHTKVKYRTEGIKQKLKTPGHYSMHDFQYGLMVRTGYRWVNFFATYELVPLFKTDKGPELTPVTFGITIISF